MTRYARIGAIRCFLPETVHTSADLHQEFPDWSVQKIEEKTGIQQRHIAGPTECASDLAQRAAEQLFEDGCCDPQTVDYLVLCTQSPDYFLPTTACILQERLGLRTDIGAFDFNQGCSGFVTGVGIAKGLIESEQASRVLLLTAETYTKYIRRDDRSVRTLFGDAAAATVVEAASSPAIGPFVYGTNGRGAENLIVRNGGARSPAPGDPPVLFMNGAEIFTFTLRAVPKTVKALLARAELQLEDVDLFVFHQANHYMIEHLRKKSKIPTEKFVVALEDVGNTVSSTIPIALARAIETERLRPGMKVMLVGFGVGYSWTAAMVTWQ